MLRSNQGPLRQMWTCGPYILRLRAPWQGHSPAFPHLPPVGYFSWEESSAVDDSMNYRKVEFCECGSDDAEHKKQTFFWTLRDFCESPPLVPSAVRAVPSTNLQTGGSIFFRSKGFFLPIFLFDRRSSLRQQ